MVYTQNKIISFPKHGKKLEFKEENDVVHFSDEETGLTFLQIPEEVSRGFYVIESNVHRKQYSEDISI